MEPAPAKLPADDVPDAEATDGGPTDPMRRVIPGVMIAVMIWGAYLALGAYFNSNSSSYRPGLKALILIGSFVLFIAFWAVMLRFRPRDE